jgi:hypothetical protein
VPDQPDKARPAKAAAAEPPPAAAASLSPDDLQAQADAADADAAAEAAQVEPDAALPPAPTVEPDSSVAGPDGPGQAEPPPPSVEPADPLHLIGERPCPTCDGAGSIPYGVMQSPRYHACDECGGVGQVLTGALVAESAVVDCEACLGRGYRETQPPAAGGPDLQPGPGAPGQAPYPGAEWDQAAGVWVPAGTLTRQ